jgi:Kae1-associated kinase Bud32
MNKVIAQGAEAIIEKNNNTIIKKRIVKFYRYPVLDEKLRKLRTRQEARLIEKASSLISVPKILSIDEENKEIILSYISGKKLADHFEKLSNQNLICKQIGQSVYKLHQNDIIHSDLTTSNMIYNPKDRKVYFIDFGLGFHSTKDEDKAVDLHVLKEALQAKHPSIYKQAWKIISKSYNDQLVLKRLQKVESRGRYKQQF